MNAICERAEMFEHLIYEWTKQVFLYFGLPSNAEPDATWPSPDYRRRRGASLVRIIRGLARNSA